MAGDPAPDGVYITVQAATPVVPEISVQLTGTNSPGALPLEKLATPVGVVFVPDAVSVTVAVQVVGRVSNTAAGVHATVVDVVRVTMAEAVLASVPNETTATHTTANFSINPRWKQSTRAEVGADRKRVTRGSWELGIGWSYIQKFSYCPLAKKTTLPCYFGYFCYYHCRRLFGASQVFAVKKIVGCSTIFYCLFPP